MALGCLYMRETDVTTGACNHLLASPSRLKFPNHLVNAYIDDMMCGSFATTSTRPKTASDRTKEDLTSIIAQVSGTARFESLDVFLPSLTSREIEV